MRSCAQGNSSIQNFRRLINGLVIYAKRITKDVTEVANGTMLDHVLRMRIEREPEMLSQICTKSESLLVITNLRKVWKLPVQRNALDFQ